MKVKTQMAHDIESAGGEVKKDVSAKKLLKYRMVLAHILKGCIKEYEGISIKDIAEKYIQKEPFDEERELHGYTSAKITGQSNEDGSADEGTRFFDLVFYAYLPGKKEKIRFIVNIEPQNDMSPGYPLVKRGFYYDARLISAQYGTEFKKSDFGKIKKVYSIWICLNPSEKYKYTITRYHIAEENIIGNIKANPKTYDVMEVIIVGLRDDEKDREDKTDLVDMLSVLFSEKIEPQKKEEILEKKYGIPFTEESRKDVNDVCNLSEVYRDRAMAEAKAEAKAEAEKMQLQNITAMLNDSQPDDLIIKYTGVTPKKLQEIKDSIR